jgi:hypothetical protein
MHTIKCVVLQFQAPLRTGLTGRVFNRQQMPRTSVSI